MSIPASYLTVILIWSTTPLAVQWSSVDVGPQFGAVTRMALGLVLILLIMRLWKIALPWTRHARQVYAVGGISMFIAMGLVYWSSQFIPSGWIAVIFGLTPILTSVFTTLIFRENTFSGGRLAGMLLGLGGLAVVSAEGFSMAGAAWMGVLGITVCAISHSLGAVVLQYLRPNMHALSVTAGSLVVAVPLFAISFALGQDWPDEIPMKNILAIAYLAIFGSAIGFPLYFYMLKHLTAARVALVTLITPVSALLLGAVLNDEVISTRVWLGTSLIVSGLGLYEYGKYLPFASAPSQSDPLD